MPAIEPTGNCFQDAIDFINRALETEFNASISYVMVHAMIIGSSGRRHSHAWVENVVTDEVWTAGLNDQGDRVWLCVKDRSTFYLWLEASDVTRYSIDQVRHEIATQGHGPPWEARYRYTCADYSQT